MEFVARGDAFDRRDRLAGGVAEPRHAGAHGLTVDQHRARAALTFAAAEFAAGEIEFVSEDREEAVFGRALDLVGDAIDAQDELRHTPILRPYAARHMLFVA